MEKVYVPLAFECGRFCVFFVPFESTVIGSSLILTFSIFAVASKTDISALVVVDVDGLDAKNDAMDDLLCCDLADFAGACPFFGLCVLTLLGLVLSSFTFTSFATSLSGFTSFDCIDFDAAAPKKFVDFFVGSTSFFIDFSTGFAVPFVVLLKFLSSLCNFKHLLFKSNLKFNNFTDFCGFLSENVALTIYSAHFLECSKFFRSYFQPRRYIIRGYDWDKSYQLLVNSFRQQSVY